MISLEELAKDYDRKIQTVKNTLNLHKGKTMLWVKDDRSFYILSVSAKQKGYQLTYFIDNEPVFDRVRQCFLDRDFIEDLALSEAYIYHII